MRTLKKTYNGFAVEEIIKMWRDNTSSIFNLMHCSLTNEATAAMLMLQNDLDSSCFLTITSTSRTAMESLDDVSWEFVTQDEFDSIDTILKLKESFEYEVEKEYEDVEYRFEYSKQHGNWSYINTKKQLIRSRYLSDFAEADNFVKFNTNDKGYPVSITIKEETVEIEVLDEKTVPEVVVMELQQAD